MTNNSAKGPQFIRFFQPVIDALLELGGSGRPEEVVDIIAARLDISEEEQTAAISSGESRFKNKITWARFYLAKAGLIDASTRGVWTLTEDGRKTSLNSETTYELFSRVHKQFVIPREKKPKDGETGEKLPEEIDHRSALLGILQSLPAEGFERLCQRLLRESGFEAVTVTGRSGDGGLDGIGMLQVNPFVSFKVLFQCKRYVGTVVVSQVRDFRGAMMGRADKGIILTTGTFTSDSKKEAMRDGVPPIELVDGEKLLDMFEQLELGLKPIKAFELDTKFFDEFR
jgi:restriction system protein